MSALARTLVEKDHLPLLLFKNIGMKYIMSYTLVTQMVKNLPAMQETQVRSLGREDPLEKRMATQSSILDWRNPWQRSLAGYSPQGRKELDMTEQLTSR